MILVDALKLIKHQVTLETLSSYVDFDFAELIRFRKIYRLEVEITITSTKLYSSRVLQFTMQPMKTCLFFDCKSSSKSKTL